MIARKTAVPATSLIRTCALSSPASRCRQCHPAFATAAAAPIEIPRAPHDFRYAAYRARLARPDIRSVRSPHRRCRQQTAPHQAGRDHPARSSLVHYRAAQRTAHRHGRAVAAGACMAGTSGRCLAAVALEVLGAGPARDASCCWCVRTRANRARLRSNTTLRAGFERKLASDAAFRADGDARLQWIYARAPYAAINGWRYPVRHELAK